MGVTRRWIFPGLRLVIWAVIAVALVKLAFAGADLSTTDDALTPSGGVVEPTVAVATATVTNAVTVQGTVVADPPVVVRATLAGTVEKLLATDGQAVAAGTPLLQIVHAEPQDPLVKTDAETGVQTVTERPDKLTRETVTAPVAGTLTMATLKDQVVSVGDDFGSVSPGTLSVTGTMSAAQQYRLLGLPAEASVSLTGGPAPFACTGLRMGAPAATTGEGAEGSVAPTGSLTCAVPAGVIAFAGLGASMEIINGEAVDALVVPVSAVQGSVQTGNVWLLQPDGTSVETPVTLGLTDGEVVQVVDGLVQGQEILEFIPVPGGSDEIDCGDPSQYDPMVCGG